MEISLDRTFSLPNPIVHRRVDRLHLFIAPEAPSWISTDDIGALLLLCFSQGVSVGEAINKVHRATGEPLMEIRGACQRLLGEILARGFLSELSSSAPVEYSLITLHLYVTRGCNLACSYCYMDGGKKKDTELSFSAWRSIIEQYTDAQIGNKVHFSGGEPLLRPDVLELGALARSHGHVTRLFTNGRLLGRQNRQLLSEAFSNVQVSLDGGTEVVHDSYRGYGSFRTVLEGLKLLRDCGIPRTIAVNVFPGNIDDLLDNLCSLVLSLEDPEVEVHLTHDLIPFGRARDARSDEYDQPQIPVKVNQILQQLVSAGLPRVKDSVMNYRLKNCGIGSTLAIDSDGSAYPCAIPYLSVGDLSQTPVRDVLEHLRTLRRATEVDNFSSCKECDIRYVCLGGCRVSHFLKRGSFLDPHCTEAKREKKYRQMAYLLPVGMKS